MSYKLLFGFVHKIQKKTFNYTHICVIIYVFHDDFWVTRVDTNTFMNVLYGHTERRRGERKETGRK